MRRVQPVEATLNSELILVTGAGGFLARSAIPLLLEHGHRVRGLVRSRGAGVAFPGGYTEIVGDIRDAACVEKAVEGVAAVVHLAARKADEPDSHHVNVGGARNLIAASRASGVRRIVNVSTQAATYRRRSRYGETKALADRLFAESGLEVATLIPSLVYGSDTTGVFAKMLRHIAKLPVVPILGSGSAIFQPVHVDDVARVILACVERAPPLRPVYYVGGSDAVSYREIIETMRSGLGRSVPIVHLPWTLSLWGAQLARLLFSHPPVTVSNVLGLASSNTEILDLSAMIEDLGIEPTGFREGIEQVLPSRAVAGRPNGSPAKMA